MFPFWNVLVDLGVWMHSHLTLVVTVSVALILWSIGLLTWRILLRSGRPWR